MNAQDLEDVYGRLCTRLTAAGEANTPIVLARLALLMMNKLGDRPTLEALIDEASAGYEVGAGA